MNEFRIKFPAFSAIIVNFPSILIHLQWHRFKKLTRFTRISEWLQKYSNASRKVRNRIVENGFIYTITHYFCLRLAILTGFSHLDVIYSMSKNRKFCQKDDRRQRRFSIVVSFFYSSRERNKQKWMVWMERTTRQLNP